MQRLSQNVLIALFVGMVGGCLYILGACAAPAPKVQKGYDKFTGQQTTTVEIKTPVSHNMDEPASASSNITGWAHFSIKKGKATTISLEHRIIKSGIAPQYSEPILIQKIYFLINGQDRYTFDVAGTSDARDSPATSFMPAMWIETVSWQVTPGMSILLGDAKSVEFKLEGSRSSVHGHFEPDALEALRGAFRGGS